jgi:hypothetical protein
VEVNKDIFEDKDRFQTLSSSPQPSVLKGTPGMKRGSRLQINLEGTFTREIPWL